MSGSAAALVAFLAVAALVLGVMVTLALAGARRPLPQETVAARGYAFRRWWFAIVLLIAVVAFLISIPWFPYPVAGATQGARHYRVVAQQYAFVLPSTVPLGTTIVFDVTSKDVNHGLGIYDPRGRLFAQVQAMPDYVNHLTLKFGRPGTYRVRCLEYCGIAHSAMQGAFEVR